MDGSGAIPVRSDLGISGGVISAIGDLSAEKATKIIDASGLYVAPGFIELHSHSDFTLLLDGRGESFIRQGVTTEVVGNCGFSCAPLKNHSDLKRNVFCHSEPYEPSWQTMAEYFQVLEKSEIGINVAPLVGHGAIRTAVMGLSQKEATDAEIKDMCSLLSDSLEAGSWGLSSGLEYFPGSAASSFEMESLAKVVKQYDSLYATHVRNRDISYKDGYLESFSLATKTGVRTQISHAIPKYGAPIEAAAWFMSELKKNREKSDIACDIIPYAWGPTTMTAILPASILNLEVAEIARLLKDPSGRRQVKEQEKFFWLLFEDKRWDLIKLFHSSKFPQFVGLTAEEIGKRTNTDPFDALLDILAEEGERMFEVLMMGKIKNKENISSFLQHDFCGVIADGISLSKSGPLKEINWSPACYGWVSKYFGTYVGAGNILSIQEAVAKITSFPAQRLGMTNRGLLQVGNIADITIFDFEKFTEKETESAASGPIFSDAIRYVLLAGQEAVSGGNYLGSRIGRVLRRT